MIEQAKTAFFKNEKVDGNKSIAIAEISLTNSLGKDNQVPEKDIISRVKLLNSLGYNVMVSDYTRYFSLRAYFRQYTKLQIGIVLGIVNVKQIFDEHMYQGLEGGILEGFGKLFPDNTRLYVYPEMSTEGELIDFQK